jgi:DNA-binding NtrC family response regulator
MGDHAALGPLVRGEEPVPAFQEATILVVDDEDALRQAVAKLLRKTGIDVIEAADGSAAIEILRANGQNIDAVLLDMTIPGHSSRDVLDAAARIRPDLKIILTSAYSEQSVTANLTTPLSRRFIRKPFQLDTLVQMLQEVLST